MYFVKKAIKGVIQSKTETVGHYYIDQIIQLARIISTPSLLNVHWPILLLPIILLIPWPLPSLLHPVSFLLVHLLVLLFLLNLPLRPPPP